MTLFLKRLFLFIIVLVVIDQSIGFLLRQLYFSQRKGQFAQTTYAVDSANQDIIVFGSSRAVRHYSPAILSKAFGKSCYNVGRDGQMIPYYTALEDVIFNRKKPSMVILDINSWEFVNGPSKYEKLSILLPYCSKHPELINYIKIASPLERYKLLSAIYPYNSSLFIATNNKVFENKLPIDENGFDPLNKKMDNTTITFTKRLLEQAKIDNGRVKLDMDTMSLVLYTQFLQKCIDANIPTYVVISPTLAPELPTEQKTKLIAITKSFPSVAFLDFSSDSNYNGHFEKFADIYHLNRDGAEEFSNELVSKIKLTVK